MSRWLSSAFIQQQKCCIGETPLSFGARPWCVVTAAASNAKWASRVTPRSRRAGARSLRRGGAALKLAAGAHRDALVVLGPYYEQKHCAADSPVLFDARPWCDVLAAASNAKPASRVMPRRFAGARCLWRGGEALELAAARAPCRAGRDRPMPQQSPLRQR